MATLSKVAYRTKSIFKWIGILILVLMLIRVGSSIKEKVFPSPKPPPTASFGKLPKIDFPENAAKSKFSYSIDTLSGSLPVFPDRISVYKIESDQPDLLTFERTKEAISKLGFNPQALTISQDTYQWRENNSLDRKITISIFSSDFTLTSSFLSLESKQLSKFNKNDFIDTAKTLLKNLALLPNDIDDTKTKVEFLYKKNYVLIPTNNEQEATDVRINFFQSSVNNLPIYYPRVTSSNMNFVIENVQDKLEVVLANFVHQEISKESTTYSLKTADQAFSELKSEKAHVVSYSGNTNNILIKNVLLAYYIGEKRQDYLMPIIVFQGENNFYAYVSAVIDE